MSTVSASDALLRISVEREAIRAFCRKWSITELAVFGSILRSDFGPESDVDFLATFAPDSKWNSLDQVHMQEELAAIVGRHVDLLSRQAVEKSKNPIRRRAILDSAQVLHVE